MISSYTRASFVVLIAMLPVLPACGDGAAVTDPPAPPPGEETDDLLDAALREAVFEAMDDFIDALPGADLEAETRAIADHLASLDGIAEAGIGDTPGSAWGMFTDSTLYFVMSVGVVPDEASAGDAAAGARVPAGLTLSMAPGQGTRPVSASGASGATYRLLNGLGSVFDDWDPRVRLAGLLDGHGYAGAIEDASLDRLHSSPTDANVFYLRTHGAQATLRGLDETVGALWTTTRRNPHTEVTDAQLFEDLRARRVGWARLRDGYGLPLVPGTLERTHYVITSAFLRHYWSEMPPDALVYLDACEAASYDAIIGAFAALGASMYVGWTRVTRIRNFANVTPFVFDRLLGGNAFEAEDPPQRPFDLQSVFAQHIGQGKGRGYDVTTSAELTYFAATNDPFILRPSIQRLEVDEVAEELIIHGLFPGEDSQVDVSVGAMSVEVTSRARDRLAARLPPDAVGDVVVRMQRSGGWIESNARPLSEWRGDFEYRLEHRYFDAAGLGAATARCRLDVRGDLHPYRDHPGQQPILPTVAAFVATRGSECELTFSGTVLGDGCTELSFSGTETLGWMDPAEAPEIWPSPDWDPYPACSTPFVAFSGEMDPQSGTAVGNLTLFGCGRISGGFQFVDHCAQVDHDWPLIVIPEILQAPLDLVLDADLSIAPGSRGGDFPGGGGAWLEWKRLDVRHPPEPGVTPVGRRTAGTHRTRWPESGNAVLRSVLASSTPLAARLRPCSEFANGMKSTECTPREACPRTRTRGR